MWRVFILNQIWENTKASLICDGYNIYVKGGLMADQPLGCARVTGSVTGDKTSTNSTPQPNDPKKETIMAVRVGQKAPEFEAPAYYKGKFTSVKLSDFAGKWVLLCFYPGDFTFV